MGQLCSYRIDIEADTVVLDSIIVARDVNRSMANGLTCQTKYGQLVRLNRRCRI